MQKTKKGDNFLSIEVFMIVCLITKQIKKFLLYKINFYPEPDIRNKINVELDSPNYPKKSYIKNQQVLNHQNLRKSLIQLI